MKIYSSITPILLAMEQVRDAIAIEPAQASNIRVTGKANREILELKIEVSGGQCYACTKLECDGELEENEVPQSYHPLDLTDLWESMNNNAEAEYFELTENKLQVHIENDEIKRVAEEPRQIKISCGLSPLDWHAAENIYYVCQLIEKLGEKSKQELVFIGLHLADPYAVRLAYNINEAIYVDFVIPLTKSKEKSNRYKETFIERVMSWNFLSIWRRLFGPHNCAIGFDESSDYLAVKSGEIHFHQNLSRRIGDYLVYPTEDFMDEAKSEFGIEVNIGNLIEQVKDIVFLEDMDDIITIIAHTDNRCQLSSSYILEKRRELSCGQRRDNVIKKILTPGKLNIEIGVMRTLCEIAIFMRCEVVSIILIGDEIIINDSLKRWRLICATPIMT